MSEPFLGQIMIVPYNFAPRNWAFCQGQILPIAQNTALFALIGTTFGGNGQTTFALPDMRGRFANSSGQGPGLSSYDLGQVGGSESQTLTVNNMAQHTHTFAPPCVDGDGSFTIPTGHVVATTADNIYAAPGGTDKMGGGNTGVAGQSQPFGMLNPYLTVQFCIAINGLFPSRN
jgi:microcystin-dependent protein